MNGGLAFLATHIARGIGELGEDLLCNQLGIAANANGDLLGQANAVRIDIDLDDGRILRPIVDAITWKRREGIETRAERQHNVCLRN